MNGMEAADQKREKEVEKAMGKLKDRVIETGRWVEQMRARLSPVMSEPRPESSDPKLAEPMACELAALIMDEVGALDAINSILMQTVDRLEI